MPGEKPIIEEQSGFLLNSMIAIGLTIKPADGLHVLQNRKISLTSGIQTSLTLLNSYTESDYETDSWLKYSWIFGHDRLVFRFISSRPDNCLSLNKYLPAQMNFCHM